MNEKASCFINYSYLQDVFQGYLRTLAYIHQVWTKFNVAVSLSALYIATEIISFLHDYHAKPTEHSQESRYCQDNLLHITSYKKKEGLPLKKKICERKVTRLTALCGRVLFNP